MSGFVDVVEVRIIIERIRKVTLAVLQGVAAVVYEYRCGAGDHIVGVASLRWAGSVHGADHVVDVPCGRCVYWRRIERWRW